MNSPHPIQFLLLALIGPLTLLPEATAQPRRVAQFESHITDRLVDSWKWWTLDMLKVRIKEYAAVRNLSTGQQLAGLLFDSLTGARYNRALRERVLDKDHSLTRYDDHLPHWQMNTRMRDAWEQRYPNDQPPADRPPLPHPLPPAGPSALPPDGAQSSAAASPVLRARFARQVRPVATGRQLPLGLQHSRPQQIQQSRRRRPLQPQLSRSSSLASERLPSVFTVAQERYMEHQMNSLAMSAESQLMVLVSAARLAVHRCREQFRGELWNCPVDYRSPMSDMGIQAIFDHPFHEYPEQDRDPYLKLDPSWNATLVFKKMITTGSREAAYWQALMSAALTFTMSRLCATGSINCRCEEENTPENYAAFVAADETAELARRATTTAAPLAAQLGAGQNGGQSQSGRWRRAAAGHYAYAGAGGYLVQQPYYAERERENQWRAMQQRLSRENQLRAGYNGQKRRVPAPVPDAGSAAATRPVRRSAFDRQQHQQQLSQAETLGRLRSESPPTFGDPDPLPSASVSELNADAAFSTEAPSALTDEQQQLPPSPTRNPVNPMLAGGVGVQGEDGADGADSGQDAQGTGGGLAYEWQSCHRSGRSYVADNVDFAARFAEAFMRVQPPRPASRLTPSERRRLQIFQQWRIYNATMHNYWVGRQMVRAMRNVTCSCQGPSGSCTLKVCHYRMRPFKDIAAALKTAYLNAVPAGTNVWKGRRIHTRHLARRASASLAGDLVLRYRDRQTLQQNFFCTQQDAFGWSGTYGRPCSRTRQFQSDQAAGEPRTPHVRSPRPTGAADDGTANTNATDYSEPYQNENAEFETDTERMLADSPASDSAAASGGGYSFSVWGEALDAMPEDPMDAQLEINYEQLPACSVVCCGRQSYVRYVPRRVQCHCAMNISGKVTCRMCNSTALVHYCF